MKQIWPNYSYSPTTNVLTLTGLNIDRDQLLLVTAADRGRIMYNFADSSVTASAFTSGANTALTLVATTAGLTTTAALVIYYDDQVASNSVTVSSLPAISGTVTVNSSPNFDVRVTQGGDPVDGNNAFPVYGTVTANVPNIQVCTQGNFAQTSAIQTAIGVINTNNNSQVLAVFGSEVVEEEGISAFVQVRNQISGTVTIGSALPTGTNRIGVVTIGAGTVTLGASTSQIGSVTASISGTVPVSGTFFQATQPVSLATLPALVAGTAQIGSVTASISNSVVTFYPLQGTTVSNTNFNSTTASTTLVSAVAGREVLTVFNEGAGNLFISAGATATTISYQVRLSAGDYWECPAGQLSLAHVAVFATAGTARVTEVS
jgi:hypothetical protein